MQTSKKNLNRDFAGLILFLWPYLFCFFLNAQVKDWPKSEYGKFFDGDSYIILHSEKDPDSNVR